MRPKALLLASGALAMLLALAARAAPAQRIVSLNLCTDQLLLLLVPRERIVMLSSGTRAPSVRRSRASTARSRAY